MKLGPIIDYIAAAALGFRLVDGIEQVADVESVAAAAYPACFVVQAGEAMVTEQDGAGLLVVGINADFDVVSVVSSAAARGKTRDELAGLDDALKLLLLGWTPDANVYRPIVPVSARLIGVGGGRASWATRFRTYYRLRKQG